VKIFGSPYSTWGSHNNAFMSEDVDFKVISKGTHIVVTHKPAILPKSSGGGFRESSDVIDAMVRAGSLLHVGGHCHWAHGVYHSKTASIPSVVASICGSKWLSSPELEVGKSGTRGDPVGDNKNGGYNLKYPVIVVDLAIPGGPPTKGQFWNKKHPPKTGLSLSKEIRLQQQENKPTLLFFGPPNDPETVSRLVPHMSKYFDVHHYEDAQEAAVAIRKQTIPYCAAVAKLGTKGNLGTTVLKALRKSSDSTFIVVHSATALQNAKTVNSLATEFNVGLIVDHDNEAVMFPKLQEVASKYRAI